MALSNFERMIQLAEDTFAVKKDPNQLDVNPEVIERLKRIHPSTMSEYADENGPIVWILLIPTTSQLMHQFVAGQIGEKQLLELTPPGIQYDALYLCSAMTLEEYRGKGIAKRVTLEAIDNIRKTNPIQSLFVWPFSDEGDRLADALAHLLNLPLLKRLA